MTDNNTIDFYNQESHQYSRKRYEGETLTYFQFLFKRRRELFLGYIHTIARNLKQADALEIGCADGVLVKKLLQKLPDSFASIIGIDVSPEMIEEARRTTKDPKAKYFLRGNEGEGKFDLVIELGVHAYDFEEEMSFVSEKLKSSGYFIYSAAGKHSLHAKIKLKNKEYAEDYKEYSEYEKIIKIYFDIVSTEVYGLFIPKLWTFPALARVIQSLSESLFKYIFPTLFHEKIYLLQKKG